MSEDSDNSNLPKEPDFEKIMIRYLNDKVAETSVPEIGRWLDKTYPGLDAGTMNDPDGLERALTIFLTAVHVLEPNKAININTFLNELFKMNSQEYSSDWEKYKSIRNKAYEFLIKIVK